MRESERRRSIVVIARRRDMAGLIRYGQASNTKLDGLVCHTFQQEIAMIGNDDGMEMGAKGDSGSVALRGNDDDGSLRLTVRQNTATPPSLLAVTPLRVLLRGIEARIGEELTLFG